MLLARGLRSIATSVCRGGPWPVSCLPVCSVTRPLSSSAAGFESTVQSVLENMPRSRAMKPVKKSQAGVLSIKNTWNNTIITISDADYNTKGSVSGGSVGFKKSKRSSFFAMEKCVTEAFRKAHQFIQCGVFQQ